MPRKATNGTAPEAKIGATGDLAHDPSTNMPPLEQWLSKLEDAELEAKNWCDGDPIGSDEQADQLTALIAVTEDAMRQATADREAETKPLHKAWKDKIAEWSPVLERYEKTVRVMKRALTPWLQAKEAEKRRLAEEARKAAEEADKLAREQAMAARTEGGSFADEDMIEDLVADAKDKAMEARAIERAPVVARGGGKVVKLRKFWLVAIKDRRELLMHFLRTDPEFRDKLQGLLQDHAEKRVRAQNGVRTLPGCSIWDEDRAV